MKILKQIKEIQLVGIVDWVWFVVYLKRNIFSRKLDITRKNYKKPIALIRRRERAIAIERKLETVK